MASCGALAAFGFGAYATVTTDNELGTVAAFLTGIFFIVVAFTGRVPRIKHGDWEMDPVSAAAAVKYNARAAAREAVRQGARPEEVADAVEEATTATLRSIGDASAIDRSRWYLYPWLTNPVLAVAQVAVVHALTRHKEASTTEPHRLDPDGSDGDSGTRSSSS